MTINLISCPRTISTALMYSFAQRADMQVLDEPFYAVYLKKTGFSHPSREDILLSQPHDEETVLRNIDAGKNKHKHIFIKNMASHFLVLEPENYVHFRAVFLIRDPLRIITSYCKVIEKPTAQDVGIQRQAELYRYYTQHCALPPIVIDSNDILDAPETHLKAICSALHIDFDPQMLNWPRGPKPYDGIWAPYWYKHVHRSTHFERQPSSQDPLPDRLRTLYEDSLESYQFLYQYSITNPDYATEI